MDTPSRKPVGNARVFVRRKRARIADIAPRLREQAVDRFLFGFDSETVADQYQVSRADVQDAVLRDIALQIRALRAMFPGTPGAPVLTMRRAA